jgi:two-component system LytT family sensor kinase
MIYTKLGRKEILKHFVFWVLIGVFIQVFHPTHGNLTTMLGGNFFILLNFMFVYYTFLLYILPNFWENRRVSFFFGALVTYLLFAYFEHLYLARIRQISLVHLLLDALQLVGLVGFAAFSNYLNKSAREKLREQNEKENILLIKEVTSLKNQFNSNFAANFLNFIQAELDTKSRDAVNSISLFKNIINYSVQAKPNESVPLNQEIEYISSYIGLHKCLHKNTHVDFIWKGNITAKKILPRILISFIENAFKHGITDNPSNTVTI